mgnify:CR=1 FL=1
MIAQELERDLVVPLDPKALARTAIAVVAMAALGAVMPIRRLAAVDPASVFSR